ncbi:MAG: FAD:protein FMN transferase [Bacilli bacterium]|nr:FAD:protein FMN transferase [Bacilli bacterium]
MRKRVFNQIILIVMAFIISACNNVSSSNSTEYQVIEKYVSNAISEDGVVVTPFNTTISLTMYNSKDTNEYFPLFEEEVLKLHKYFDRYNYYQDNTGKRISNLKVINDSYGTNEEILINDELYDLLNLSLEMTKLTKGYFNPTLGGLIDLWSDKFFLIPLENTDPDNDLITEALKCSASKENIDEVIVLNPIKKSVIFNKIDGCNGKVIISLGAIAKGYAMEKAKSLVKDVPSLIDGGRSSLIATGTNPNPNRDTWNLAILTPYTAINLGVLAIKGELTFSTSGDYEKCFYIINDDGSLTIRHHILNPSTGYSENYYRSISLLSDGNAGVIDALSTALFNVNDIDIIDEIVKNVEDYYLLDIEFLFEKEIIIDGKKMIDVIVNENFWNLIVADSISSVVNIVNILE